MMAPGSVPRINLDGQRLPGRVFLFCLLVELLLVALDAFINYGRFIDIGPIRRLFNIAREDGLATWFMVIQTFLAGLVLWLIALVQRSRSASRSNWLSWGFLAGFFIYMSADDAAEIHERIGSTFKKLLPINQQETPSAFLVQMRDLFPSYDWHLFALPLLAGAGLLMMFFLLTEFRDRKSRAILFSAVGIMAIAVLLDFFEGLDRGHAWNLQSWIRESLALSEYTVRHFSKSLEEFLEMCSISLLLMLFIAHLISRVTPQLTINVDNARLATGSPSND
jgi:hypothetical protein